MVRFAGLAKAFLKLTRLVVVAIADMVTLAALIAIALRLLVGEQWELVAILNSVLHLLLIGAVSATLVHVWQRRRVLIIASVVVVGYFIVSYGTVFLPNRILAAPTRADLRVMTYNLHAEINHLEAILAVLREADADVIALQEVSVKASEYFAEELSSQYPHAAYHVFDNAPILGQAVLSKYPIEDDLYWRNTDIKYHLAHQRVVVRVNNTLLVLYNAHPIHPLFKEGRWFYTEVRTAEIQSVLARAELDTGNVLVIGDFNMSDQSEDYTMVTQTYRDAYRDAGWGLGFTYPDYSMVYATYGNIVSLPLLPCVRLDYQFYRGDLAAVAAKVWHTSGGSDHRPVLVDYAFASPK